MVGTNKDLKRMVNAYEIKAGVLYGLDQYDNHTLTEDDGMDLFLISVKSRLVRG